MISIRPSLWKQHWGFIYFILISVISFGQLLKPSIRGHYRVFTSAARFFWNHEPTYMTDFGWNTGLYWFYSPTCALTFYLPFSFMPETFGVLLSTAIMWLVFVLAARYFFETFGTTATPVNLFWFLSGSEMIGAITSQKTEILIVALCLFSVAFLARGRAGFAGIALALVTNWKFQPLALVGLLTVTEIIFLKRIRFASSFVIASAVFAGLPYLLFDSTFVSSTYGEWLKAVQYQLHTQWQNFDHVTNVAGKLFQLPVTYETTQWLGGLAGSASIALLIAQFRTSRDFKEALVFAGALAAVFMTSFSPLSQSNGYILLAPALAAATLLYSRRPKLLSYGMAFGWIFTSLLTSDLVPKVAREFARANALKAIGPLILITILSLVVIRRRPVSA